MSILLFVVGLLNLIYGMVVFGRTKASVDRWMFLSFQLAETVWAWGIAAFVVVHNMQTAQVVVDTYYVAALWLVGAIASLGLWQLKKLTVVSATLFGLPAVVLAAWLYVLPQSLVQVVGTTGELTHRVQIQHPMYEVYAAAVVGISMIAAVLNYLAAFRAPASEKRSKFLVAHAICIAGVAGLVFNLFLPGSGEYSFIAIGPLFTLVFAVSTAFTIVRYSMFDFRRTVFSSFAYAMTFGVVALLYAFLVWVGGKFIMDGMTDPQVVTAMSFITVVLAAVTFEPIRRFINLLTDKIFFRHDYDPQAVFDEAGKIISSNVTTKSLIGKTLLLLDRTLKPDFASVCIAPRNDLRAKNYTTNSKATLHNTSDKLSALRPFVTIVEQEPDGQSKLIDHLKQDSIALVARLSTKQGVIGHLVVGTKKSGERYSRKDLDVFSVVADELAVALENSLRYEQIKNFNETLQTKVDSATAQLKDSNKKLFELDKTKDDFISMTSHQLRTPLTTIKGYISMLLDGDAGELSAMQRKMLTEAFNSSQRMAYLIGDFLNVSRLQTGKFMLQRTAVNLADLIDEEIGQLEASAASRHLTLRYDKPNAFPVEQVDEDKIRQVMMNFIDNAIYYSPAETAITISLGATPRDITFKVVDQGIGVPPEVKHKLFTKFYRAPNAVKQRPDGTGIGLYMAKKVIVAHGGAVIFESKVGKGSTFGFVLPRGT